MRESRDRLKDILLNEALPALVGTALILTVTLGIAMVVTEVLVWLTGA